MRKRMPFRFAILLQRRQRVASGQRIAARACRDAAQTVAKSNFFDYDGPLREPVALPLTAD